MTAELIHLGFGNMLAINRVIAILTPNSAPTKRMMQEVKTNGLLIDMTNGRRTKAVIIIDSGHLIVAAITPETIVSRLAAHRGSAVVKGDTGELEGEG